MLVTVVLCFGLLTPPYGLTLLLSAELQKRERYKGYSRAYSFLYYIRSGYIGLGVYAYGGSIYPEILVPPQRFRVSVQRCQPCRRA